MVGRDKGRCLIWLVVFSICLQLPPETHEFNFGFGEGDDEVAEAPKTPAPTLARGKKLGIRRTNERKFKFHKLERVDYDDEDADPEMDVDDGNGDDNNDDDGTVNNADSEENNNNYEENDRSEAEVRVEISRSQRNKAKKRKERGRDDKSSPDEPSLMGRLVSALFTGWAKEEEEEETKQPSNNIIDWLQWLIEQTGNGKAKEQQKPTSEEEEDTSLLSYLRRWPFTSLFPIEQLARHTSKSRLSHTRTDDSGERCGSSAQQQQQLPISEELLMHWLPAFVVNASHVEHEECRQQLQLLYRHLREHSLWTLQMLDATGKVGAGILRGNINQFGDFDLCTQVRGTVKAPPSKPKRIRGKYCLAHVEINTRVAELKKPMHLAHGRGLWYGQLDNPQHIVPRYTVANWGVCVPHACSASVVSDMLHSSLHPYNGTGVRFYVEVEDKDCSTRLKRSFIKTLGKNGQLGMSVSVIFVLLIILLSSLVWEKWAWLVEHVGRLRKRSSEEAPPALQEKGEDQVVAETEQTDQAAEKPELPTPVAATSTQKTALNVLLELLRAFSPLRTAQALLSLEGPHIEYPLLHMIKVSSTLMLYISLKYLMDGHLPLTNRDSFVQTVESYWSVLFRTPLLYSDALLLVSGFLATNQLFQEIEQKAQIHLLKNVLTKATRTLPIIYAVLSVQTWILPHLGAGPLWNALVGENARLCSKQMWRNAFSIQNVVDFEEACSPLTLQLAVDVQLYLLAPLLVWLYSTDSEAGFFVYGALHALSVAARYARTAREHLSTTFFHGMHVSMFYRTANLIYTSPVSRATPYLLGIGVALLYRSEGGSFSVAPRLVPVGWALSALSIGWCFLSAAGGMHSDFVYSTDDAAAYAAWSPLVLGLVICWCILMAPWRANVVLRYPNVARPLFFLSKIALPLQLATYVVVLSNTASVKEPLRFNFSHLFDIQEIGFIVCLAIALAFLIDVPAQHLRRFLVERIFVESILTVDQTGEQSEAEQSETVSSSEHLTSDTPEPPNTIWASDPEEEEQKYIARRRSSVPEPDKTEAQAPVSEEDEEEEEEEE